MKLGGERNLVVVYIVREVSNFGMNGLCVLTTSEVLVEWIKSWTDVLEKSGCRMTILVFWRMALT
jgi:hypothetical protein